MEERARVRYRSVDSADKEDRISALPDSVIQHILTFLPSTKAAIRTSILSKRWRYQWTHVPVLIFKPSFDSGIDYFRFIENTLILHDCPKIEKFHLQYEDNYQRLDDCQFTSKIRFAIRRCVEELNVICSHMVREYWLPENLFQSASLVRLELVNCDFKPNWRVCWPSLRSLTLDFSGLYFNEGSRGIENVVSGSPSLESLELRGYMPDRLGIVSKSLKILSFVGAADLPTALKISCPNLVELSVVVEIGPNCSLPDQMIENVLSGSPHICMLKLVKCYGFGKLVIASISLKVLHLERVNANGIEVFCPNLERLDILRCNYRIFRALNLPSAICATIDYTDSREHSSLNKMLEQFQHVNELTIGSLLFKFLSELDMEGRMSFPSLSSKCLTLNADCEFGLAIPGITYALHSPSLEELIINFEGMNYQDTWDEDLHDYWNSNGHTGLTCLESHLKTVKITGISGNDGKCRLVFEFIEFLLTNAKVLKKMIVALNQPGQDFLFEVSQKLSSSRSACIELLSY